MNPLLSSLLLGASLILIQMQATASQPPDDPEPTVLYLIDVVAKSEQTFVRNSRHYSGTQAAEHLRRKYNHLRERIGSTDDFIELAASRSMITGKPYLAIDSAGRARPVSEWLRQVLSDYCAGHAADSAIQCSD
jgi:hypothetical protein